MKKLNSLGIKYFVVNPNKALKEFQVFGAGIQEQMRPGIVDRPQGTGDRLFMYFYDAVKIKVNGMIKDYPPGTMMIWDDGAGHYYGNPDISWTHSWLHCKGDGIRRLLRENNITPETPLVIENPSVIESYLMIIYSEISRYKKPDRKILLNLFENFLMEIKRGSENLKKDFPGLPQRMLKVKNYIDTNFASQIKLKKLAGIACISVPHLSAEFKKAFGVSPMEYVISVKMQNARYLLLNQNQSVSEIAGTVGFKSLFQFSKSFKNRFSISPRAYRDNL